VTETLISVRQERNKEKEKNPIQATDIINVKDAFKTTSFTPPSVIKLHLLFAHASSNNKKTKPTQKIIFRQ
jgi:hypothetical protein